MRVILASGSPRRRELLRKIYDDYEVVTAPVDERAIEKTIEDECEGMDMIAVAEKTVLALSRAKALAVFDSLEEKGDTLVIGADTTVALPDEILGKPADREDAVRMLRKESLDPQRVLTGVTLVGEGFERSFVETSLVVFNELDEAQETRIQKYCDTDEPYDKAGAYGIQALGDELVDRYEGEFYNIMGLPVERLRKELEDASLL